MIKIKEEVLPSNKKKNKNYKKPNFLNDFERTIFDEKNISVKQELPKYDNNRQDSTNNDKKEEVLKMVDRMAIKMILSIELAIMKYIKDSTELKEIEKTASFLKVVISNRSWLKEGYNCSIKLSKFNQCA